MKKLAILGGLVALLVGSVLVVPAALAAAPWAQKGAAPEAGYGPADCPCGGVGAARSGVSAGPQLQRIATFLGVTADELKTQLQAGKTLAQIAEAKSITRQALVDFVLAPIKDMLQLRVKYGYLTQAQVDEALKARQEWVNTFVDRVHNGPQAGLQGPDPAKVWDSARVPRPDRSARKSRLVNPARDVE